MGHQEETKGVVVAFSTKINGLALCRGSARNMEPLLPGEGKVFVAGDIISAEPVIQCNLTGDSTLIYQTFEGIGLKPWVREDGLLMLDDIYLAFASINPVTSEKVLDIFYNYKFEVEGRSLSWSDAWVEPGGKDIVKSHPLLKKFRKFAKGACLGLSYGLKGDTPDKTDTEHGLRNNMTKQGYYMTSKQAWECYEKFWGMYPEIRKFRANLEALAKKKVPLYNPFGFKVNTKPKDAFNGVIQSTVSSVITLWEYLLEESVGDKFDLVMCIHDEGCVECWEEDAGEVTIAMVKEMKTINEMLGWKFPLRTEPRIGRNFYEIK